MRRFACSAALVITACAVDSAAIPAPLGDAGGDAADTSTPRDTGTDVSIECPPGQTDCGGRCVDLRSAGTDCGACDNPCPSGSVCSAGACASMCAVGETDCAGGCRDLDLDRDHCGTCSNACDPSEVCTGGSCESACDWSFRRTLTFDNSSRPENLDDFTVLVQLDDRRIDYAQVEDQGRDLRFTEPDGTTALPYEVERWSEGGQSFVWVQVPRIDASSDTDHIIMYYGNSAASVGARPSATWDALYEGVWHLGGLSDSTGNGHEATDMGTEGAGGRIGRARRFDGSGDHLVTDTVVGSAPDLTFELWMQSDVDTGFHRPIDKMDGAGTQGWSVLQRPNGDTFSRGLVFRVGAEGAYGGWGNEVSASDLYAVDTWVFVVGTYDSATTTGRLYVDGVEVDAVVNTDGRGVANTGNPLVIGSADGFERFDGEIDEVRVSRVARSAAYVSAQYDSQRDVLIEYGAQTPVGLTCPE